MGKVPKGKQIIIIASSRKDLIQVYKPTKHKCHF